jgi:hypothetical protein
VGKYLEMMHRELTRSLAPSSQDLAPTKKDQRDVATTPCGRPICPEDSQPEFETKLTPPCGVGAISAVSAIRRPSVPALPPIEPDRSVRCSDFIRFFVNGRGRADSEITAAVRQRGFNESDETKARAMLLKVGFRAASGWFGLGEPATWQGYGIPATTTALDPMLAATSAPTSMNQGKPSSPFGGFSDAERIMLKVINKSKNSLTVLAANARFLTEKPTDEFRPQSPEEATIVLERLATWQCIIREDGEPVRYRRHDA